MRTTTRPGWHFTFTISDLGRLLCKSPVTLRGWESKGILSFPRDESGDRSFGTEDVRKVAAFAREHRRITEHRYNLIAATMTLIEEVERENDRRVKR